MEQPKFKLGWFERLLAMAAIFFIGAGLGEIARCLCVLAKAITTGEYDPS